VATILKYRKIFGETKAELHHNYVGEIERGEKAATIDTIMKIAKALGVRAGDLFSDV